MEQLNLAEVLNRVDPSALSYQEWVNVGMALKQEGYPCEVWDSWSQRDSRYHPGECEKKWQGFHGSAAPVTGGTIVQLAREQGWYSSEGGHEIGWGDVIRDELTVVDPGMGGIQERSRCQAVAPRPGADHVPGNPV